MVKTLDITELQQLVGKLPEVSAAGSILKKADVISVKGLHGSSRALFSSALFNKNSGVYLYILNDAESAGYFYHDLTAISVFPNPTSPQIKRSMGCSLCISAFTSRVAFT